MLARLAGNWVYGGAMAAVLMIAVAPLLTAGLGDAGRLVYCALVVYMLHQYEEHDADRFRRFVNATVAKGRAGLSEADVFMVNIVGVWGGLAGVLWLTARADAGWAVIAGWLLLINAVIHIAQGIVMRRPNPGLWTAILLFVPLGTWILLATRMQATGAEQALAVVLVVALHAAIVLRAARPADKRAA